MDSVIRRNRFINGIGNDRIGKKITLTNGFGNTGKVLINDTTRTQIHVTDFGVTHLTIRQTDIFS